MLKKFLVVITILELFVSIFGISGCGSVPRNAGFDDVQKTVNERSGKEVYWRKGDDDDQRISDAVHKMLQDELRIDEAVQIALLQNRSLQAVFEELGIAQADLVQAGLLENPVLSGHVRFPDESEAGTNTELAIVQNFMDLLVLPLRKKVEAEQFKEVQLRVSKAAWHLSLKVRRAYFSLQGLVHTHSMLETVVQAAEAAAEFADRQWEAGNINALELASEQASFEQAKLSFLRIEAKVISARERLNWLMGFEGKPSWKISERLPNLPTDELPVEELESKALSQNLELAIARQEIQVLERDLALVRRGIVSRVALGLNTEREPDRTRVTGPMFDVELPVFDHKQAATRRLEAQLRQSQHRLKDEEARIRSEVRSVWHRLRVARQMVEQYREKIIPLREKIVSETQKHVNFMLIGVFQLLQTKRDEINAYRKYIEAFQDYWTIRTNLERIVGYRLVFSEKEIAEPSDSAASSKVSHAHH